MIAQLFLKVAGLLLILSLNGNAIPHKDRLLSLEDWGSGFEDTPDEGTESSAESDYEFDYESYETNPSDVIWPDEDRLRNYLNRTFHTITINNATREAVETDLLCRLGKILPKVAALDEYRCFDFRLEFKGSSYEGLRIGLPDEYDYGLVNDSWSELVTRQLSTPYVPGFGYAFDNSTYPCLDRFKNGSILDPAKVKAHLKKLVKQAMDELHIDYEVIWDQGPAVSFTYRSDVPTVYNVDVDLAIGIKLKMWPQEARDLPQRLKDIGTQLVPKSLASDPMLWQISFSQIELQMMRDIGQKPGWRKQVLMLAKYCKGITDGTWDPLQSYHLKMVFLNMTQVHPNDEDWTFAKLPARFQELIMRLLGHVRDKHFYSYFVPELDLFRLLNETELARAEAGIKSFLLNLQNIADATYDQVGIRI